MHKLLSSVLLTLLLPAGAALAAVQVNQPAPDFSGVDTAGTTHRLSDYRGKIVVLEWTNHDCPYVRKHYGAGNMQTQQRDATGEGVVWLSVISSRPGSQGHVSPAEADRLTQTRGAAPSAVILDERGDIGRLYGARTTPHMYVVDASGVLRYMGGIDSIATADPDDLSRATQYVPRALSAVRDGAAVDPAVTRPYGCSVKY